jgi:hypothetical protein
MAMSEELILPSFEEFQKIPRLRRDCVITEKIDGTNAQIYISDDSSTVLSLFKKTIEKDEEPKGARKWWL